ncbi:MAG: GNAT family N-acetyltransferase [Endomicrobiaceae bacterium]|jgi:ribosomal protein S18 acetylase RimI-like enzyme|nr:GNAT family N-acetyltransferase [Endomicrobiaceae bacterium]MDD3729919.1 GNAT family N-acetyltransferase [Endomicrobiaceae bacterium]MDD4166262.1 GNAT family N-acetyltransferase [Endomicrobiaceae bacterium]
MTTNIIKAQISDINILVDMHIRHIGDSFFSYLGKKFLRIIYAELIFSKYASTYVYINDGHIIGYISFILNKKLLFIKILFTKSFVILFSLNFISFLKCIFYFFSSIGYIIKKQYCKSELLFIAVNDDYKKNGIGSKLVDFAETIIKQNNIYKVQVSINDENIISQILIKNKKYIFYRIINFYGKKMNMYYKQL